MPVSAILLEKGKRNPYMNISKKLTLKTIGVQSAAVAFGAKAKLGQNETNTLLLARIYGICIGSKVVASDFGDSNKLVGEFEAYRVSDGATFASNVCYLPGGLDTSILIQLSQGAHSVSFAYDIFAEADKTLQGGYKYIGSSAIEARENDPLEGMRKALVKPVQPQLAAPEAVAEPAKPIKKGKAA